MMSLSRGAAKVRGKVSPPWIFHDYHVDFTVYPAAGFTLRWYALTLDLALSAPLQFLVKLPFDRYLERLVAYGHRQEFLLLSILLAFIPFALYVLVPTTLWGVTLGKKIVGLRVISDRGEALPTFAQVFLRETIGKAMSVASLGIGFVMVTMNPKNKALHDFVAATRVVCHRGDS